VKYLVLLAVVVLAVLYWRSRSGHGRPPAARNSAAAPPALPEDMVRCRVCALHLPRAEATEGTEGRLYCGREHLLADAGKDGR
jgi:uncharacterized protein